MFGIGFHILHHNPERFISQSVSPAHAAFSELFKYLIMLDCFADHIIFFLFMMNVLCPGFF